MWKVTTSLQFWIGRSWISEPNTFRTYLGWQQSEEPRVPTSKTIDYAMWPEDVAATSILFLQLKNHLAVSAQVNRFRRLYIGHESFDQVVDVPKNMTQWNHEL